MNEPVDESLIKDLEENAGDAGLSIEENELVYDLNGKD